MARIDRYNEAGEDYRRIPKSVSLPSYLVRDLEAQGKLSRIITEILENHKQAIGDGVYKDALQRRKELLTQDIDEILRERLPVLITEAIDKAVSNYLKNEK